MNRRTTWTVVILGILSVAAAGTVAAEEGVTETTLKFGTIIDEDGPAAFMGKMVRTGMEACVRRINDEGGVHGRKLVFLHESDGYQGPRAVAAATKLIDRDKVFCMVGNMGVLQTLAIYPILEEKKVPLIFPAAIGYTLYNPPRKYVFGYQALRSDTAKAGVDFIVNDLKMGKSKIAFIGQEDVVYQEYYDGVQEQMKGYGISLVAAEWYKRGAVDLGTQVLNLKQAGAEVVIVGGLEVAASKIIMEAAKLGWKPVFILDPGAADKKLIELAGKEAVEGVIVQKGYPLEDSDAKGIQNFKRDMKRYFPDVEPGSFSLAGYIIMTCAELAFKDTGRNITREGMMSTIESWNNRETGFYPLTFGEGNRVGSKQVFFAQIKAGRFVQITDWRTPRKF
jgi:branched-chain amino acid transport system substrate-binding protein